MRNYGGEMICSLNRNICRSEMWQGQNKQNKNTTSMEFLIEAFSGNKFIGEQRRHK